MIKADYIYLKEYPQLQGKATMISGTTIHKASALYVF